MICLQLNDWIRSADCFDYLFDAEEIVKEEHSDGIYFKNGCHQGDRLHPNEKGGKMIANAYDFARLTGKEPTL
jgi:lysophospholipase L1-like esterase